MLDNQAKIIGNVGPRLGHDDDVAPNHRVKIRSVFDKPTHYMKFAVFSLYFRDR
jgi:hypothetical protein